MVFSFSFFGCVFAFVLYFYINAPSLLSKVNGSITCIHGAADYPFFSSSSSRFLTFFILKKKSALFIAMTLDPPSLKTAWLSAAESDKVSIFLFILRILFTLWGF